MSIFDGMQTSEIGNENSDSLKLLTNTKNFDLNKILTELAPNLVVPLSLTNVIQKRYHSTFLKGLLNELYLGQMAKDRQRVLEVVEVSNGMRNPITSEGDE